MCQTVCKTYFSIKGIFNTTQISDILKIKNTGGHNIGEKKRYSKGFYDWASWEYGTDDVETLSADEQAVIVVSQLISKIDKLLFIKEKYQCEFILMQVSKVEKGITPSFAYNKIIIDFCSKTDTQIEIDLYVNPYSSELDKE